MFRFLRRLRREFDWEEYVREHFTVKNTPSDELRICCFVCGEQEYKLYVNPRKATFICFKCDFSGKRFDLFDFVAKAEGISRYKAIEKLGRLYARLTPNDEDFSKELKYEFEDAEGDEPQPTNLYEALHSVDVLPHMPDGLERLESRTDETARFWDYLTGRGVTPQEIVAMSTYYSPATHLPVYDANKKYKGDLGNRVVYPIYGGNHELVSWQGRSIDPKCPKSDRYMTAPNSGLSKTLWPFVKPFGKHAVLVEGIYDCLAVRRVPKVSAYATFSKKVSRDQMLRLKFWGVEEITLFWDRRDALKEMKSAVEELHMNFKKVYVLWQRGWDKEQDAGNMLADSQGADKLKAALDDRVDTYDALEFAKWELSFDC